MKPIDAFRSLLQKPLLHGSYPREPGGMLRYLTKEEREALKGLTSDEVSRQRIPHKPS